MARVLLAQKENSKSNSGAMAGAVQQASEISKTLSSINNGLAAADAAPSTVVMGVELIKKTWTSPVADDILKVGKVASKTSTGNRVLRIATKMEIEYLPPPYK